MTVNLNAVGMPNHLTTLVPTYPSIEGMTSGLTFFNGYDPRVRITTPPAAGGPDYRIGARITLPVSQDLSGYDWLSICQFSTTYGTADYIAPLEQGGLRIIYVDGSGNYAGFNLYGEIAGYSGDNFSGYLTSYTTGLMTFHIASDRVPDISSGAIDWSNIIAYEFSLLNNSHLVKDISLFRPAKRNALSVTGTETFQSIRAAVATKYVTVGAGSADSFDNCYFITVGKFRQVNSQTAYYARLGFTIGNGTTPTTFIEKDFSIGFENPYELFPEFMSTGQWILFGPTKQRPIKIIQSSSCTLSLTDGSFASSGIWQWRLSGSGIATLTRVDFWRFDGFTAAHGDYIDCSWNEGWAPVVVSLDTTISGGVIREAHTTAIEVSDGPGNYAGINVDISGSVVYDLMLGAGGAGTYQFPNIRLPEGYTLRLHNNSPSNAITIEIPSGVSYTTTTDGGLIEVAAPEVIVDIIAPALVPGSRVQLYNVTDATELLNTVLPLEGLVFTLPYTADKVIRLRADHATKLPLETLGVLTTSGLTLLNIQEEDGVYQWNGIDGSTVTEFSPDSDNIQVDINDDDGVTNIRRLYAWLQWFMTTEEGVRSPFFGAISATDTANYVIDQAKANIQLDNISTMPVRVVGGYLSRKDGSTVIAPLSYSIQMDPGKAYAIETGISGLTVDESSKLDAISTLNTGINSVNASIIAVGSDVAGVSGDMTTVISSIAASQSSIAAVQTTANAIADFAEDTAPKLSLIIDNTTGIVEPPSSADIADAVWSDVTVSTLADKTTTDLILLEAARARQLAQNRAVISDNGEIVTIYNDDNTTILLQFSISADKTERQLV